MSHTGALQIAWSKEAVIIREDVLKLTSKFQCQKVCENNTFDSL